jgi:hypothetical protein
VLKANWTRSRSPPLRRASRAEYVDYHPVSSITGRASIEFDVNATGEDYLDLANSLLHVRAKIVKANGEDLEAGSPVGPVNNCLHSLFSQVDISLDGTLITSSTKTYAYGAYIETLLSYGSDAKVVAAGVRPVQQGRGG